MAKIHATLHALDYLPEEIKIFLSSSKSKEEYHEFVHALFIALGIEDDDPILQLLEYLEKETDFYTAPASTRFHSSETSGLVRHSLLVVANGIRLAPIMLKEGVNVYYLVISCLLHDFCKVNMYEISMRNSKNEETGIWEKVPYYKIREDYLSYGHGVESMIRLNKFINMPESWNHAVRWHMGAYDMSAMDKIAMGKSIAAYKEVLFLQTADMQAGLVDEVRHRHCG